MDRRTFLAGTGAVLLAAPLAEAQQAKVYRAGVLYQGSPPLPGSRPLLIRLALKNLGYIEGQNIVVEIRWAEGQTERFPTLAAELAALNLDVIVADSTPAALAARRATTTIPIVMVNVSDPVGSGLVASLSRPGGNVTGGTDFGLDVAAKRVELMHAAVPKVSRLAVLMSDNPVHPSQLKAIEDAARNIGLSVLPSLVTSDKEFERAFASMVKSNVGAVIVLGGAPFGTQLHRDKMIALAAKAKLPAIYEARWYADAGGLLSYGPSSLYKWTLAAKYVDQILKGAKPGDLPVQQPTQLELIINLKTAKALGLTMPPSLLGRADEVIQ